MRTNLLVRRASQAAFALLLAVIAVQLVLTAPMEDFCALPEEFSFSQEFVQSLWQDSRSEIDLMKTLYREIALKLLWHGATDELGIYGFGYICQPEACVLEDASVDVPLHHHPMCRFGRAESEKGTIVEVNVDFGRSQVGARLHPLKSATGPGPHWTEIAADIESIKTYALNAIGRDYWLDRTSLYLSISKYLTGWRIRFRTLDGHALYGEHSVQSPYERMKE